MIVFFYQFELLPIDTVIQTGSVGEGTLPTETLEECFEDLLSAQALVKIYEERTEDDDDDDVQKFREELTKVMHKFRDAISIMNSSEGKEKVDACLKAYQQALGGNDISGKFCQKWKKISKVGTLVN